VEQRTSDTRTINNLLNIRFHGNNGSNLRVTVFTITYEEAPMTATATPTLTAADRCDRCGAQAYVRIVLPGGGELLFCAHHYSANASVLAVTAVEIVDETHRLS